MTDNYSHDCCICFRSYGLQDNGELLHKKTTTCNDDLCVTCFTPFYIQKYKKVTVTL